MAKTTADITINEATPIKKKPVSQPTLQSPQKPANTKPPVATHKKAKNSPDATPKKKNTTKTTPETQRDVKKKHSDESHLQLHPDEANLIPVKKKKSSLSDSALIEKNDGTPKKKKSAAKEQKAADLKTKLSPYSPKTTPRKTTPKNTLAASDPPKQSKSPRTTTKKLSNSDPVEDKKVTKPKKKVEKTNNATTTTVALTPNNKPANNQHQPPQPPSPPPISSVPVHTSSNSCTPCQDSPKDVVLQELDNPPDKAPSPLNPKSLSPPPSDATPPPPIGTTHCSTQTPESLTVAAMPAAVPLENNKKSCSDPQLHKLQAQESPKPQNKQQVQAPPKTVNSPKQQVAPPGSPQRHNSPKMQDMVHGSPKLRPMSRHINQQHSWNGSPFVSPLDAATQTSFGQQSSGIITHVTDQQNASAFQAFKHADKSTTYFLY